MPWVFFDDQFPIHRKVTRLSDPAFRLHVSAIFWCARNLTDGVVPEEDLEDVTAQVRSPARFVPELLKRRLWHEAGEACPSEMCTAPSGEGWVIHDYLAIQPSKDKVTSRRKDNAERQRRWRERQKEVAEHGSRNNGASNALRDALVTAPRSRPGPEGTRDGTTSQSSNGHNARRPGQDDDSIDLAIVELYSEITGRDIGAIAASQIRRRILDGHAIHTNALAYVTSSIRDNPGKFLPPQTRPDEQSLAEAFAVGCQHGNPQARTCALCRRGIKEVS